MELDVTNKGWINYLVYSALLYLCYSPPTAIVDLKDKIGSFDARKYDYVNECIPPRRDSVVSMSSETDSPLVVTGAEQKFTYEGLAGRKNQRGERGEHVRNF